MLRFILQAMMLVIFYQWKSDPQKIQATLLSKWTLSGYNKFKQFLYGLGLRAALAVTIWTLGMCCALFIPLALPLCSLLFLLTYMIEKYNLLYIYPIDFESKKEIRKVFILSTCIAILLAQAFGIQTISGMSQQSETMVLNLWTVLGLQALLCLLLFCCCGRNPWKGAKLRFEEVEQEVMNERMFDVREIGKYDFGPSGSQVTNTQVLGRMRSSVVSEDIKAQALVNNYVDPMADAMQVCQESYKMPINEE